MLKILERSIALQLLVFYGLFLIPLILGGAELYQFQRDALQQNAQQTDSGIAQAIALQVEPNITAATGKNIQLSTSQLAQLSSHLAMMQQQLTANGEIHIWVLNQADKPVASTEPISFQTNLRNTLPALTSTLQGKDGSMIIHEQNRDWLYTYLPIAKTRWAVVVQRPTDVTFAAIISFQNSLLIALVTLLIGASLFWFALHGWMVAPLAKLAQAVTRIKPDQTEKITDGDLLAKDRNRVDEIGQLIGAISLMEDEIHTLFRKSDEKSQSRLHTLDAIMRSMDEGVLLERPDGQIIYANQGFFQFVGISPQELPQDDSYSAMQIQIEQKLLAMIVNLDAYREAISRAEQEHGPQIIEFQVHGYYNQVGQLVPVRRDIRLRLFQVQDLTGQIIGRGKLFRDMTQQNEAEQIKQNLLAIVSHELRTPLTTIKGYATSLLATDVELDEDLQKDFLQHIVGESDRMADLVTNLLEMSQLEAGTLRLTPSLHRLDTIVEQAVSEEDRHLIRVHIPENVPLLHVDRRRIEVVLHNLVENGYCYAGTEAVIEIAARYEQGQCDRGLYLSIADNGPGLPSHLTERIFDRFYQIDGGRKRSSNGVGLGLAICKGFIEAHGGRIWAENRTDGVTGAVFTIWFSPKVLYIPGSESNMLELHKSL